MKRVVGVLVCFVLLLSSCGVKIEDEGAFLSEVGALIEESYKVNQVFFGQGVSIEADGKSPKEVIDSATAEAANTVYLPVGEDFMCQSAADVRAAAESVYSEDYVEYLNTIAFEGLSEGEDLVCYARYVETFEGVLTVNVKSIVDGMALDRTYDLSTLSIVRSQSGFWSGGKDYVLVSVDAYENGELKEKKDFKVVREESGWRLDWPTY